MIVTGAEIMFESEIEQLKKHLAAQLPQAQPFVYLHEILESGIDDCYKQSIQAEVDWWIYEEQIERTDHPHFDTSAPELQEIFASLDDAYRQYAQFNISQLNEAVESAVKVRLNFLCRPRTTLKWFIYRGAPTKTVYEIVLRLAYFHDYNYLITGFHEWAQKTYSKYPAMDLLSVVEFEKILETIDNDYILDLSPHQFVDMLIPLFEFFHLEKEFTPELTIPTEALIVFLDDKGVELIAHEIERLLYNEDMENISQERFLDIVTDIINQIEELEAKSPGTSNQTINVPEVQNTSEAVETEPGTVIEPGIENRERTGEVSVEPTAEDYDTNDNSQNDSENEVSAIEVKEETLQDIPVELHTLEGAYYETDTEAQEESIDSTIEIIADSTNIEEVIAEFSDIEDDILGEDIKIQEETSDADSVIENNEIVAENNEPEVWEFPLLHSDYDDVVPVEFVSDIQDGSLLGESEQIDEIVVIEEEHLIDGEQPDENLLKDETEASHQINDEATSETNEDILPETDQHSEEGLSYSHENIDEYSQGTIEENNGTEPDESSQQEDASIHEEVLTTTAIDSASTIDSVEITEDIPIETIEIYGETPYELDEYLPAQFSVETIEIAPGSSIDTHVDSPSEIPASKLDTSVEFAEVLKDALNHDFTPEPSEIEVNNIAPTLDDSTEKTLPEDSTTPSAEENTLVPAQESPADITQGNFQHIQEVAPVAAPIQQEVQQQNIPSIAGFIDKKQHDEFVKKLCSKDEEMFSKLVADIDNCPAWKEAAQIIDKFFLRHKVDHRSAAAISFRTIVQKRYSGT